MDERNKILVVDDDTSNIIELHHILHNEYDILTATDGISAIEIATEYSPDLILLDLVMLGMDGFEVFAELKKSEKTNTIPVIFITGIDDSEKESTALSIGAVDYIRKPFDASVVKLRAGQQIKIINLQRGLEKAAFISESANKFKTSFLANMSHEMRTPLNAITGITDLLLYQNEALPGNVVEGLGMISISSDILLNLIDDILDLTKIEAGKVEIVSESYDVANLINDATQLNMVRIGDKPLKFEVIVDENIPSELIGDELRIKQILNNLLTNSFKYTDAGKVSLLVDIEPDTHEDAIILVLCVQDTGQGMTEEQLTLLFEEYVRFNEARNRGIDGVGLGLSIVQHLVDCMGGTIRVHSRVGLGTSMTVRLPQKVAVSTVLGKEGADNLRLFRNNNMSRAIKNRFVRTPMPHGRVLVVDDTVTNLFVATQLLRIYKLQVTTATNGKQAVELIEQGKTFDIIFMDIMMPVMDGLEATKRLRDSGYTGTIIALTANAVVGQAEIFLQNGFDEFISKPIDSRRLDHVLNEYIRDKQPSEAIEKTRLESGTDPASTPSSTQEKADRALIGSVVLDISGAVKLLENFNKSDTWTESEREIKNYITAVHKMKSVLEIIGESSLSNMALELEHAGNKRDIGFIIKHNPEFTGRLRVVLEKCEEKSDIEIESLFCDIDDLCGKLLTVKELCEQYSRKGVFDAIAEIEVSSSEIAAVIAEIKNYVAHSDFEEAADAAAAYVTQLTGAKTKKSITDKEIAGIDIPRGLARYNNDEQVYLRVLHSFLVSVRSNLSEIEIFDKEQIGDYRIKVHGIKGACLDIFAKSVGDAACTIEKAAVNGDVAFITEHHQSFLEEAHKLMDNIDDTLTAIALENPKPKKDRPEDELLSLLRNACEDFEATEANRIMAEIEKYQYESDDGLVKWLRNKIALISYSEIVHRLQPYK